VRAICDVARARGALTVLDNTWATPLYFRAFDHGIDVSVHAATKYIGGHSDVLLGAIVANEAAYEPLFRLWTDMGITASSDDCFLGLRGLRTLAARLDRQQASAMRIAQWLQGSRRSRKCCTRRCPARAAMSLEARLSAVRRPCSA
jgi:cystathionine beta-lyase